MFLIPGMRTASKLWRFVRLRTQARYRMMCSEGEGKSLEEISAHLWAVFQEQDDFKETSSASLPLKELDLNRGLLECFCGGERQYLVPCDL